MRRSGWSGGWAGREVQFRVRRLVDVGVSEAPEGRLRALVGYLSALRLFANFRAESHMASA